MTFYVSLFNGSIEQVEKYGPDEPDMTGLVKRALFQICDQRFSCIDSPITHKFSFTPAISIYVECETEKEIEQAFAGLSEGGEVLMPLDNYGFSLKFGWLNDRYGVSWQLNLSESEVVPRAAI